MALELNTHNIPYSPEEDFSRQLLSRKKRLISQSEKIEVELKGKSPTVIKKKQKHRIVKIIKKIDFKNFKIP